MKDPKNTVTQSIIKSDVSILSNLQNYLQVLMIQGKSSLPSVNGPVIVQEVLTVFLKVIVGDNRCSSEVNTSYDGYFGAYGV